jgi:hypothetical protein
MAYIALGGFIVSIGSSFLGASSASKQAEKTRELQKQLKLAELASTEKLTEEKIRADQENYRLGVLAGGLTSYRETLQKESTIRLRDTWLTTAGTGVGLGVLYGLYLMTSND